MKIGSPLIGLGVIFLLGSFLIPFHLFLPAWFYWDGSDNIGPGEAKGPTIGLIWGSVVRGMLIIGGGNKDIYFSVKDSDDKIVIPEKMASDRYYFEFQPTKTTSYHFILDNRMSWFTQKSVYWIVWTYCYNLLFLALGFLSLISGIFIAFKEEKVFQRLRTWQTERSKKPKVIAVKEPGYVREIVKEIVKIRCPYCGNLYDEKLDKCPHCGGKRS